MTNKPYRWGDLALVRITRLPDGLKKSDTNVVVQDGSGGNPHTIKNGELYFKNVDQYVIGYLVAKNTTLYHKEHGDKLMPDGTKEAKIADGVYEIRRQNEESHEGMRVVVD